MDYDYGELIPAGYRQHYLSGVEITRRYNELFAERLRPDEYYLRCSRMERTYNSQFSFFMAFDSTVFPKESKESKDVFRIPHGIDFPIIHSVPFETDYLIRSYAGSVCMNFYKNSCNKKKQMWKDFARTHAFKDVQAWLSNYLKDKKEVITEFEDA
jgi:hypothetical protein